MTPAPPKFGVRFLTRKERTVRRVTKCETREIKKRLEPSTSPSVPVKKIKTLNAVVRPKPATLVKIREPKKVKPMAEVSSNEKEQVRTATSSSVNRAISATTVKSPISSVRTLQTTDLQRLSR
ncbi:unnamed protein product, partial [Rotaria magnacalcarata]